jgi:hypothetical protein
LAWPHLLDGEQAAVRVNLREARIYQGFDALNVEVCRYGNMV